ncbi:MAG: P-loop NTPase [Lentisphaeria bacterium]|jgi:MinD superfamily P-loop ATPase|nr:P-loop NTPase [Lentisphaeria bacterium]
MILAVASGKGGTGKTTFAVNLAFALARRAVKKGSFNNQDIRLLDCDVEEPNNHLFVRPEYSEESEVSVLKPVWEADKCTACGLCAEACNYNAIALVKKKILVFNELCHSCGVCSYVCPSGALREEAQRIGKVQADKRESAPFFFAQGKLDLGEALAPTVVGAVKKYLLPDAVNIIDASPGTSCPVVAALKGADRVLLVTEPTPFGLNDLKLAVGLSLQLGLPTGIIVNRSDGEDKIIADYARQVGLPIAGRIPFSRKYAEAYAEGAILVERFPELEENLLQIYDSLQTALPPMPEEPEIAPPQKPQAAFEASDYKGDYKEITVISGKGGTGKTTLTACLAQLAERQVLADNDVDAADLHLLLKPELREKHDFIGGVKAEIDPELCIACGDCAQHCHFDAIAQLHKPSPQAGKYYIDPVDCEGCGLCPRVCPVEAISSDPNITGCWFVSNTDYGPMVHARLGIAEENSGRLVTQVRERAAELARELGKEYIIADGPPGTGCPVIASISGSDLVLVVTEPTVSGVHDMQRVLELSRHFGVPAKVVINKADLNLQQAAKIEDICSRTGAELIGRIPFDLEVNAALMAGKTVLEHSDSQAAKAIRKIWQTLKQA